MAKPAVDNDLEYFVTIRLRLDDVALVYLAGRQIDSCIVHIFDLISVKSFSNLSLSIDEAGHPIPRPSISFGFGIHINVSEETTSNREFS